MKARVIAYYLPQYHPIPENDKFWGKGFTEWTNVAKAKPLFKEHKQPRIPADLGFYDLRLPEVREEQAKLAKKAGVEGFCYWHYWFGNGKRVLERPFNEVLSSEKPDFPFCLGWANHSWTTKTWEKGKSLSKDTMIFEQLYPGEEDYKNHFYNNLPAFKDKRYITVDEKPLFLVFSPLDIPDSKMFIDLWNKLAIENGLKGIHFVGKCESLPKINSSNYKQIDTLTKERFEKLFELGYNGVNSNTLKYSEYKSSGIVKKAIKAVSRKFLQGAMIDKYKYTDIIKNSIIPEDYLENVYPQLIPGHDRSPRAGRAARVYYGSTPEKFKVAVQKTVDAVKDKESEHKLIFLNAWNEWGEGSYMEPDIEFGHGYIDALSQVLK